MCAVLNCCAYITQIYYIIFFYCWCAFCSIERMTNNPSVIIIHRVSKKLCQCYSLNNNSGVSWSSSALLCLWCDVMWHCPSIWKQVFFSFFHQDRLSWWKKEKKTCFQMLQECQEAASVSKRRHNSTSHWFWLEIWADACATQYEFIVVNGQTTTSAFHKVV